MVHLFAERMIIALSVSFVVRSESVSKTPCSAGPIQIAAMGLFVVLGASAFPEEARFAPFQAIAPSASSVALWASASTLVLRAP
jgi:hypothetical protein